jgi:hypothetical protein
VTTDAIIAEQEAEAGEALVSSGEWEPEIYEVSEHFFLSPAFSSAIADPTTLETHRYCT